MPSWWCRFVRSSVMADVPDDHRRAAVLVGQTGCIDHVPAIVTREGTPDDFDRYFEEGFSELGPESRHLRFFTAVRELTPEEVDEVIAQALARAPEPIEWEEPPEPVAATAAQTAAPSLPH